MSNNGNDFMTPEARVFYTLQTGVHIDPLHKDKREKKEVLISFQNVVPEERLKLYASALGKVILEKGDLPFGFDETAPEKETCVNCGGSFQPVIFGLIDENGNLLSRRNMNEVIEAGSYLVHSNFESERLRAYPLCAICIGIERWKDVDDQRRTIHRDRPYPQFHFKAAQDLCNSKNEELLVEAFTPQRLRRFGVQPPAPPMSHRERKNNPGGLRTPIGNVPVNGDPNRRMKDVARELATKEETPESSNNATAPTPEPATEPIPETVE